jgi:hypothetical protein
MNESDKPEKEEETRDTAIFNRLKGPSWVSEQEEWEREKREKDLKKIWAFILIAISLVLYICFFT